MRKISTPSPDPVKKNEPKTETMWGLQFRSKDDDDLRPDWTLLTGMTWRTKAAAVDASQQRAKDYPYFEYRPVELKVEVVEPVRTLYDNLLDAAAKHAGTPLASLLLSAANRIGDSDD